MAQIDIAFNTIIRPMEGVYSNVPGDNGGITVWGIAYNYNKSEPLWLLVDQYRTRPGFPGNLNNAEIISAVTNIYKKKYWDVLKLDEVNNQQLANELFDISVNCGSRIAALFLQRSLNVLNRNGRDYADLVVDAQIGIKTISAANVFKDPRKLVKAINALQGEKYISICERNPSQEKFMNGWIERVNF